MDMGTYLMKIKLGFERHHCVFNRNLLILIVIVNNFSNFVASRMSNFK